MLISSYYACILIKILLRVIGIKYKNFRQQWPKRRSIAYKRMFRKLQISVSGQRLNLLPEHQKS